MDFIIDFIFEVAGFFFDLWMNKVVARFNRWFSKKKADKERSDNSD